jgi:hypothetical protein
MTASSAVRDVTFELREAKPSNGTRRAAAGYVVVNQADSSTNTVFGSDALAEGTGPIQL